MKLIRVKSLALISVSACILHVAQSMCAAPFLYHTRDMMLCFRKTGQTGGSTGLYDFEVNIGQASGYYGATPGTFLTVTQFTAMQLAAMFDDLNAVSWSVGAAVQTGDTGDPSVPINTLWVTAPRDDPAIQTTPWLRRSYSSQGPACAEISSILTKAAEYSSTIGANSTNNTATAVRIPDSDGREYSVFIGPNGNYSGYFAGVVENTTPLDFTTANQPSRSDLYELRPSTTNGFGRYLGFFEFRPDGTVVFAAGTNAPVSSVPPPPVLNLARAPGSSLISFASTNGAGYSLRFTNASGLSTPISSWPLITNVVTGNGGQVFVTNTTADLDRFYVIEAH